LLADALLGYGASVDHGGGAAIQFAVANGQESMVVKLLAARSNVTSLPNSMQSTSFIKSVRKAHNMIRMLISVGARGDAVADAVIGVVKWLAQLPTKDERKVAHDLLKLLPFEGEADVNFKEGTAIQFAVSAGDIETDAVEWKCVRFFSSFSPFPLAMALKDKETSFNIVQTLLAAGTTGQVVDEALVNSIAQGLPGLQLITLLIKKASVDYKNGKALVTAIAGHHIQALELLLEKNSSNISLSSGLNEAKK
jgi:hypothetical protein